MKESEFIEQNKEKWLEFEENIEKKDASPVKISKLFIQISDDLSFARTFYNNRSVKIYLNGVAKLLLNSISRADKSYFKDFLNFWRRDLPLSVYASKRAMLISFVVFLAAFCLGVVTSIYDEGFAKQILGSSYVNMTEDNIAEGDPMGVYKRSSELEMFLHIFWNNFRVDMLTFFAGLFAAIGTLLVMVYNGVMLGVFQFFFIERGVFWESFLGVWTHGALEISTIIIAGGAGIMLGRGFLFPGTYTRFQAFRMNAMHGLKIILGIIPITFAAAFIEGFMTRHTEIHNALRLLFILCSFGFMIMYFYWYPRQVVKRNKHAYNPDEHKPIYKPQLTFNVHEALNMGKLITETIRQLFKNLPFFLPYMFGIALLVGILIANDSNNLFHLTKSQTISLSDYYDFLNFPSTGILNGLIMTITLLLSFWRLSNVIGVGQELRVKRNNIVKSISVPSIISSVLFVLIIMMDSGWYIALAHIVFPFLVFITTICLKQNITFFASLNVVGSLLNKQFSSFIVVSGLMFIISWLVYVSGAAAIQILFVNDALMMILTNDSVVAGKITLGLSAFELAFSSMIYVVLTVASNYIMYYTFFETYSAQNLLHRISQIKLSK